MNSASFFIIFALIFVTSTVAHPGHHGRHNGGGTKCGKKKKCHAPAICIGKNCIVPVAVGKGKSCDGQASICKNNLICDGPTGSMICKKPLGRGKPCTDTATQICKDKLVCDSNGNDDTMKTCKKARGTHKPCGTTEWTCKDNLICTEDNKVCAKTVAEGKKCDDLGLLCGDSLSCIDGVCAQAPRRLWGASLYAVT